MKRVITTLSILLICLASFAQKRIDFFDFYQKFSWDWTKESFEKKYRENISITSDGFTLTNVVVGDHIGDMFVGIDEKSNKTVLLKYDIPIVQFSKSVELFKGQLFEPAQEEEKDGKSTLVWVNDDKILLLVNIDELCGFTCMPQEIWEQFAKVVNDMQSHEHLKFKGIPIDGTPEAFTDQLIAKGFSNYTLIDGTHIVEGPFAGYDKARVYVKSTNNIVYMVSAYIDLSNNWSSVKSDYLRIKESLTRKYNVKPDSEEIFPKYLAEGSGLEFSAFKQGKAKYESVFPVQYGVINLAILAMPSTGNFSLLLTYYDSANAVSYIQNAEDDL